MSYIDHCLDGQSMIYEQYQLMYNVIKTAELRSTTQIKLNVF